MDNVDKMNEKDKGPFFHGTKAVLEVDDMLDCGFQSNYQSKTSNYIYFTATLDAAKWGAELSFGDGCERIYVVEPTGDYYDDPNVTNKRFPGNPTRSYRSKAPLRITAELKTWKRHNDEDINHMLEHLKRLKENGETVIDD